MDTRTLLRRALSKAKLPTLVVPLLIGLLLVWQHSFNDHNTDALIPTGYLGFFWCLLVTILAASDRCSELELALPLSGRAIWKNNVATTSAISTIHVAVFILPITITGTPFLRGQFLSIGGHMLAGLILLGSLIHGIKPGRSRLSIPALDTWAFYPGLVITLLLVKYRSPWLGMGAVAVAGLILLQAGRQVKETLTLTDDRSEPRGGYASLGRWEPATGKNAESTPVLRKGPATAGRYLSTLWMLGTMSLKQFSNISQGLSFVILFILGEALVAPEAGFRMVPLSVLGTLVLLGVLSPELIRSGSPYSHLPIPRRRLHAGLLLPVLATIGLGAAVQIAIDLATGTYPWHVRAVEWVEKDKRPYYTIRIPAGFHQVARDGQPPAVVGSTGETYTPVQVIRISPEPDIDSPVIYNPYEVGRHSSKAFATEQYIRAVKAVYDVVLDREQAELLITEYNGRLDIVDGLTIARTTQRTVIRIFIFCTAWMLLGTLFALFARLVRPARFEWWRTKVRVPALFALAIVFTAFVMATKTWVESTVWFEFYVSIMMTRLSAGMPGAFLSLGIALICLATAWLLSQELFARREVLPGGAE
jgi:hypothetical protein